MSRRERSNSRAVLLVLERLGHRLVERWRVGGGGDVAGGEDLDRAGVLEARDGGGELGLRELRALLQVGRLERVGGGADGLGDVAHLIGADLAAAREEASQPEVLGAVEEHRLGRLAVAPGAADLLEVRVDRLGDLGVEDEAHVGLVDAHPEGGGRDDHVDLAVHEALLGGLALARPSAPRGRRTASTPAVAQRARPAPRCAAASPRRRCRASPPRRRARAGPRPCGARRGSARRPARCSGGRTRARRSRGRAARGASTISSRTGGAAVAVRREHGRVPERLDGRAEAQVVGPEVVSPLARCSAPRRRRRATVPRRRARRGPRRWRAARGRGRGTRARPRRARPAPRRARASGRLEFSCAAPSARSRRCVDLVALQGDERRDDERRALAQQPGELVDRRLARARSTGPPACRARRARSRSPRAGPGRRARKPRTSRAARSTRSRTCVADRHERRALPARRAAEARPGRVGALRSPGNGP